MTAYERICESARRLDDLDARGLNDSPEADAIRDETDAPWLELTDQEKADFRSFSESLYLRKGLPMGCSDNTTFPAAAASQIGQAILAKDFSRALVPPVCDLICFGNYKLGGGDTPTPAPPVPVAKLSASPPPGEADVERIGHMLIAASDMHGRAVKGSHDLLMPLPWSTILSVLFTILQGILLGSEPAPVNPAQQ